jgi:hypothetical protein
MENMCVWALINNGYEELYIKSSSIEGKGLFTCKNLPAKTVIYGLKHDEYEPPFSKSELLNFMNISTDFALKRNADNMLRYVNHSCRPNAFLNSYGHLINPVFIFADSEINIDYSTILTDPQYKLNCLCNKNNCRQVIQLNGGLTDKPEPVYDQFDVN